MNVIILALSVSLAYGLPPKYQRLQENPCQDVPSWNTSVLLSNPDDCESYIQCDNSWPVIRQCPDGLHWSASRKLCDWPSIANCKSNQEYIHSSDSGNQIYMANCENVSEEEQVFFPHPTNCSKFYQCASHHPIEMECPTDLHWSVSENRCEYPSIAQCNSTENTSVFIKVKTPTGCENVPESENVLLPNPEDCGSFIQCVHQKPEIMQCPEGLHWSIHSNTCEEPWLSRCNESKYLVQTIYTVSSNQTGCEGVPESINVLLPNPTDCGSYIQCVHQRPMIRPCPAGLHWSIGNNRCEWPSLANCNSSNVCDNVSEMEDVLLPNPNDCKTYFQCVHQKPVLTNCPSGLHWSIDNKRCQWPSLAKCQSEPNP